LPVASGREEIALLDYRDFMAEAAGNPSGGPGITAVLNRRNEKANALIKALQNLKSLDEAYSVKGLSIRGLKKSLTLGRNNLYTQDNRTRLASELQRIVPVLDRERLFEDMTPRFSETDMPSYFDGEEVRPFGGPH